MMDGYGNGYGMGTGGWILMILFWVLIVGLIVFAVIRIFPGRDTQPSPPAPHVPRPPAETPRDILDRRLAGGEIDLETYDRLREKLGAHGTEQ
jgi:putative membrane protein